MLSRRDLVVTPLSKQNDWFWNHPDLPAYPNIVSVSMSGGVDSSLVAYLLALRFQNTDTIIQPLVGEDVNRASVLAAVNRIIEVIKDRVPEAVFNKPLVNEFIKDEPNTLKVGPDIVRASNCDVFVKGSTLQPDHLPPFEPGGVRRDSNKVEQLAIRPSGRVIYKPLYKFTKRDVATLYTDLDLMNDLYPLTLSCVNILPGQKEPCKECLWCQEKMWAFGTYDLMQ